VSIAFATAVAPTESETVAGFGCRSQPKAGANAVAGAPRTAGTQNQPELITVEVSGKLAKTKV
jgi:hypothetical protein